MTSSSVAIQLAEPKCASLTAAAGCGKTYALASAVAKGIHGRQLILTHTHAGADVLRHRLRELGAENSSYRVDTISAWAMRLSQAFPKTSGITFARPAIDAHYKQILTGATRLLRLAPIQRIVAASYSGVLVDEYQDCTVTQHDLIGGIAQILPCRLLGDPLQGIFGFKGQKLVDWPLHVLPGFPALPELKEPWRWKGKNEALGKWLISARTQLENGQSVDLNGSPVKWIDGSDDETRRSVVPNLCLALAGNRDETVIAIGKNYNSDHHDIAKRLRGVFSCIEPVHCPDLFLGASAIDAATGYTRALEVIAFAAKCMTEVNGELQTIIKAFKNGRTPNPRKNRNQLASLLEVVNSDDPGLIEGALRSIRELPKSRMYRKELFGELCRASQVYKNGDAATLEEGATLARNRARHAGRRIHRCAVGSTLLVKGLEFEHAILLDGDCHDAKNLYVALTRGARSLTIVSRSPVIDPH